ncbi:MAG: DMT family transporter [Burkholderiaceae bacterium]
MRTLPLLAVAGLLTNATVWGMSWIGFKGLQAQGLHPLWATAVIYSVSTIALALWKWRVLRDFALHAGLLAVFMGSGLTNAFFNTAVAVGDVVRVVLLFYLMPIWAVLLARVILHDAITQRAVARVALGLIGAFIVLWQPKLGLPYPSQTADWLAIGGGFFFALNNVMLRKLNHINEWSRAIAMFAGGAILSLLGAVVLMQFGLVPAPEFSGAGVPGMLAFWTLMFLVGNLALQYGVGRLPANITAVIMLTEILIASLSAWMFGGAEIRVQDLIGGLIIISAPWLIQDRPAAGGAGGSSARAST